MVCAVRCQTLGHSCVNVPLIKIKKEVGTCGRRPSVSVAELFHVSCCCRLIITLASSKSVRSVAIAIGVETKLVVARDNVMKCLVHSKLTDEDESRKDPLLALLSAARKRSHLYSVLAVDSYYIMHVVKYGYSLPAIA